MDFAHILLEAEQEELLGKFVEADRNVPAGQRNKFLGYENMQGFGTFISVGMPGISFGGSVTDAQVLVSKGLLGMTHNSRGAPLFYALPEGRRYYEWRKGSHLPAEAVEQELKTYLSTGEFRTRYPSAFDKWSKAHSSLWSSESQVELTTIGHLCREAMQEFAEALVTTHNVAVDPDKAKIKSRMRSVFEHFKPRMGSSSLGLLDALLVYWEKVNAVVQRQVHGALKEGEPLRWDDARRVVFYTCAVMHEVDRMIRGL